MPACEAGAIHGLVAVAAAGATDEATELAKILIKHAYVTYTTAQVLAHRSLFNSVWREAVRHTHPDTNNGRDGCDFRSVINARELIKTLKGWQ